MGVQSRTLNCLLRCPCFRHRAYAAANVALSSSCQSVEGSSLVARLDFSLVPGISSSRWTTRKFFLFPSQTASPYLPAMGGTATCLALLICLLTLKKTADFHQRWRLRRLASHRRLVSITPLPHTRLGICDFSPSRELQ